MLVKKLQHYNIRTTKFDETVAFYRDVLGMTNGVPPMAPEGSPPAWLYDESGEAIVHLMKIDPTNPDKDYAARAATFRGGIDPQNPPGFSGSGSIDHVALHCEGWEEMQARLKQHKVPFHENHIPKMNFRQMFIRDPNGVTLELNFPGA